jgi:hypothetical protein
MPIPFGPDAPEEWASIQPKFGEAHVPSFHLPVTTTTLPFRLNMSRRLSFAVGSIMMAVRTGCLNKCVEVVKNEKKFNRWGGGKHLNSVYGEGLLRAERW